MSVAHGSIGSSSSLIPESSSFTIVISAPAHAELIICFPSRLTISNFKNNELPTGVVNVSYELEISSLPLSSNDKREILDAMIEN